MGERPGASACGPLPEVNNHCLLKIKIQGPVHRQFLWVHFLGEDLKAERSWVI
jgi:hypothetical protein